GVDERGDGRRARHGVGQPDVEGDLGRLPRRTDEEEEADHERHRPAADGRRRENVQVTLDRREVEGPVAVAAERPREEKEAEEEARVADAVHEEGLLPRRGVLRLLVPEADQGIGAEPHALPADEEERQVVGEHEDEHRGREQVQVGEVAREAPIAVHAADRVDVHEKADARHHERHDRRECVEPERGLGAEGPRGDPGVEVVAEEPALGQRAEPERGRHGHRERRAHEPRAEELHSRRRPPPEEDVEEHARGRQEDDPAEERRRRHHRSVTSSSAFIVSPLRKSAMMIARPTAASAAATVITKKTITCPSIEPRLRASATKVRLTAFSMSSIAMKMTITLRRMSTPSTPIANSTALSPRYQASGGVMTASWRAPPRPRWPPGGGAR